MSLNVLANGVVAAIDTVLRGSVYTQVAEMKRVSSYINLDLDETGVVVLNESALLLNGEIFNSGPDTIYVKAYSKATAATSGDTPLRVWELPPGSDRPFQLDVSSPIAFPLGLSVRCTLGRPHNDNVSPGTNVCLINLGYRTGGTE